MTTYRIPTLNNVLLTGIIADSPVLADDASADVQVGFTLRVGSRLPAVKVIARGQFAKQCHSLLAEGDVIYVEGELQQITDSPTVGIHAVRIQVLNSVEDSRMSEQSSSNDAEIMPDVLKTDFDRYL